MTFLSRYFPITLVSLILTWVLFYGQYSQQSNPSSKEKSSQYCGSSVLSEQLFTANPEIKRVHDQLEDEIYNYLNNHPATPGSRSLPNYTLPVVVHIIHNNGSENISDALVFQGIQHLNESFANSGYYDQGTGVNTQIEFCLAQRDPDGNATNGITRDASPLTNMTMETEDIDLKNINRWDPLNYINIWLVNEICSNSIGCGVAGYAYFPSSHGGTHDGIVAEAKWIGSSNANSAILTHELGHYLGLYHTFEGGCPNNDCLSNGDRVCDTPPDQSTAAVPCNASANSCSTDVNAGDPNNPFVVDQNDMFWNYMDYGNWACYSAFTAGQAVRMEFFINGTRSSLLASEGCTPACMSPMTASFSSSANPINIGNTVNFTNTSTGATAYEWLIDGVPFSNSINASYNFPAEGFYVITLNVTNNDPNCFETFSETIEVICPVVADFDASASIAQTNEVVVLTNTSVNATDYEWTLNGAPQGNSTDFSFSLTNPSIVQICLEATGALCDDTHCEYISIISNGAGGCDLTYIKNFGNVQGSNAAQVILPALDGDFFIAGNRIDSALLMKVTPEGVLVWSRTFKVTSLNDDILDLALDSENKLIVVGNGASGGSNTDCFVFKYDHINDNVEWVRIMPGPEQSRFWAVEEKAAGDNYIIVGQTSPNSSPGAGCDAFVMELERNAGTVEWMKNYHLGSCESAVDVVIDGNTILITGRFNFAGGGTDKMRGSLTRLDFSGNELWSRLYLVPVSSNARIYSTDLLVDNGNIINVSQGDNSGTSIMDVEVHLYSTDLDGNIAWAQNFDIPSGHTERISGLANLSDGYLIFGDYTDIRPQLFLIKTNKQGQLQWSKTYTGGFQQTSSKGMMVHDDFIYLIGDRNSSAGRFIYLAKLNLDGELSDPCDEIEDLIVEQTTINSPYDGLHPLTVYDPALPTNSVLSLTAHQTSINEAEICSSEECCESQTFVKTIGDAEFDEGGSTVIPSGDGGLFVAGYYDNESLIMKMTAFGELIWARKFDFVSGFDRLNYIFLDSDNYLVGCGHNSSNENNPQGFVFKYDYQNDNLLWNIRLNNGTRVRTVLEPDPGGDYVLVGGMSNSPNPGNEDDLFLLAIDRSTGNISGNLSNQFSYNTIDNPVSGIVYENAIYAVGRYTTSNSTTGNRGSISKFDLNGNHIFSRLLNFNPSGGSARLYTRDIIGDNGYLVSCTSGDDNGTSITNTNFFLTKHDPNGNLLWAQKYDIADYQNEWAEELIAVADGYIIYGNNRSGQQDIFLVKTDKEGNLQWAKKYGEAGDETTYFSYQSSVILFDNHIYLTSHTNSPGGGGNDILLAKTGLDGNVQEGCGYTGDLQASSELLENPQNNPGDLTTYTSPVSLTVPNAAPEVVELEVNGICESSCIEICSNGIDDDGDQLIDFYDPDCPCVDEITCGTPFYNICATEPECESMASTVPIEMEPLWSSDDFISNSLFAVADIDGDCISDIVSISTGNSTLLVRNSSTGVVNYSHPANILSPILYTALGDVDNDGMAEIFYVEGTKVIRLDFDPGSGNLVQTWQSSTDIVSYVNSLYIWNFSPSLADFDANGIPEVYVGNQIFNSQNGLELANGGLNNQGIHSSGGTIKTSTSVAADVLADEDCVFCQGLELVAGGQVYTVNLVSYTNPLLNDMSVEKEIQLSVGEKIDGITRVVDFDKDGDLDVVISTNRYNTIAQVFVWDVLSESLIGNLYSGLPNAVDGFFSATTIGDVDNDGWPEIIIGTSGNLSILEDYQNGGATNWGNTGETLRATVVSTDYSGGTGNTVFDLNGDGVMEIAYRDQDNLKVFDGNLNVVSSTSCTSGTFIGYPVIADINNDDETEILCGCDNLGLTAFQSANIPWQNSRKIWNQYNYFVTNINDDGTIPVQQQNPHIVGDGVIMNGFSVQQAILDGETTAVPDATLMIDSAFCNNDAVDVFVTICNTGDLTLTELTPITIYFEDPTASVPVLVTTIPLGFELESDSCLNSFYTIPNALNQEIFIVVNDDGSGNYPYDLVTDFPVTSIGECDFENNIDDIEINGVLPPPLDLGPDVIVCDNGVFEFSAGSGFDHYEWQNGSTDSTFTTWASGTFWVTAWNDCGERQSDTVSVMIDIATVFDLGLDTVLCGGGAVSFAVPGYDKYEWFPKTGIDCDTCEIATVTPSISTTYTLVASTDIGCISVDSIEITIAEIYNIEIDTSICAGETVTFDGIELQPNTSTNFSYTSVLGCDSSILVNVLLLDTLYAAIDTSICEGDAFIFDGQELLANTSTAFNYTSVLGCDSTLIVNVFSLDTFYIAIDTSICEGETVTFDGMELQPNTATYFNYTTISGCDSTILVNVNSSGFETYFEEIDTFACLGNSIFYDGILIPTDSSHVFDLQTILGCDSTVVVNVMALDTFYNTENLSICEGENIVIFGNEVNVPGEYSMSYSAANGCDSTVVISLEVFESPELSLTAEPSCSEDSTGMVSSIINGGTAPFNYNWSTTPENIDELQNVPVGAYSVTVTDDNNCTDSASIEVNDVTEVPVSGLSIDISCFGEADGIYQLDPSFEGYLFSLDGNLYQNTLSFTNLNAGTYDLYIQDPNGCEYVQSFIINEPPPLVLTLPQDITIEMGDSYEIESMINTFDSLVYFWDPPTNLSCLTCPSPFASPVEGVLYTLTVMDSSGCVARDDILIEVDKDRNVFIPNVFSPNFDGTNDIFMVYGGNGVEEVLSFTIFDRWGEQLFEAKNFQPNDPVFGWNGTFKGEDMDPAVFVYMIEILFVDERKVTYKGDVTLVK